MSRHIYYDYGRGVVGTARIPVIAIYSGKILAPLESHTSSDSRSNSLGDIDLLNADHSCFESIEIKHRKPITADMVGVAYRKIKTLRLTATTF